MAGPTIRVEIRQIIEDICRNIFGNTAHVASVQKLGSQRQYGILKRAAGTRNTVYRVRLLGENREYVFRFHRGGDEDRYRQESENLALVAAAGGVRVPDIYHIDRTRTMAPTPYMVMEFLPGERWEYLTHLDNPQTSQLEKKTIQRETGRLYARVHSRRRPAGAAPAEAQALLGMLERLEAAVRLGHIDLDLAKLSRCRRAVEQERWFLPDAQDGMVSLCLVDSEIFFTRPALLGEGERRVSAWNLSFLCDAEWVDFRDRCGDLVPLLCAPSPLWELDRPLICASSPGVVAGLPFFQGYAEVLPVDAEKLAALCLYYQLRFWGNVLFAAQDSPQKRAWIRRCRGALVAELVERIAAKADPLPHPNRRRVTGARVEESGIGTSGLQSLSATATGVLSAITAAKTPAGRGA